MFDLDTAQDVINEGPRFDDSFDQVRTGKPKRFIQVNKNGKYGSRKDILQRLLDNLRHENETMRKPCETCGTLVKPELQHEHDAAYHTQKN